MPDIGVAAMENWGLITFREASLMYDPKQKFSNSKALTCLIVAHEIGHQACGKMSQIFIHFIVASLHLQWLMIA